MFDIILFRHMEKDQTKEKVPELAFAHLAPEVWDTLGKLSRTGWVNRGVENPETVQEHTLALVELATSFDTLSNEERDGLAKMLEIHDWPEAIHGDEVILTMDAGKERSLKAMKFENEQKALAGMCEKLGEVGKEIMSLWLRFETSKDPAASFARQLDKYQAIEKSLEYERAQGIPMYAEFRDYSKSKGEITHPLLLAKLLQLELEWKGDKV